MIRKITVIVASGDADTQWRRIRKSAELRAELRAEHCAEHPAERVLLTNHHSFNMEAKRIYGNKGV